ncbi:MAG: phospholipase D-like domain-containing protein, partial [Burkholderiaceae bacterium]
MQPARTGQALNEPPQAPAGRSQAPGDRSQSDPRSQSAGDRQYLALPWYESLRPVMRGGHEVTLLDSGGEFFPALEAAISEARQRIFLETYIFEDDRTGRRIAAALAAAAARGVSVHVLVDGFGTQRQDGEWVSVIRDAGVSLETFRPERHRYALNRKRLRRLHRKLAVIDGCVAFVGGLNVLDDYYDPNHGDIEFPRLDYAVRVRGPLVAHVHVAVARLWWELSVINRSLRRGGGGGRGGRGRSGASASADAGADARADAADRGAADGRCADAGGSPGAGSSLGPGSGPGAGSRPAGSSSGAGRRGRGRGRMQLPESVV